jgi:arylsulfatase A-like enzyme
MTTIRRSLVLGAAFGLTAAAIDLWLGLAGVMRLRMGPGPGTLAQNAALLVSVGALLGLLGAPLLRVARAGRLLHLAWLGAAWYALERWVAVESPLFALGVVARPVGATALGLLALLLARTRWPARASLGLVAAAAIAGVFAPGIYLAATTPEPPARAALPPAREGAPDVVLVVLDTVRAQSVTAYGHARDTSPTLDAIAREGALFEDATSPSTWSLPSHASLFTGRYPSSHRAYGQPSFLDDRFPTLAEVLAARGYDTHCFTANPWISDGLGLTRGFAGQDESWKAKRGLFGLAGLLLDRIGLGESDKGGAAVAERFAAWRSARPADARPSFVFLNFLEAHFPYHQLPRAYRDRYTDRPAPELREISLAILGQQFGGPDVDAAAVGEPARDLYDGGVAYTDALLRSVVDALRAAGTLDRTVLVVLADHGEILGEHGGFFGHGPSLYQYMVGVPLVVRYPARIAGGTRVAAPVSTLGVFATILDLAEIEPPPTLQVGSLAPLARGEPADGAGGPVLSEMVAATGPGARASRDDVQMLKGQHLRAYRSGDWKLVETSQGGPFLYDLASDPAETRDLARERPEQLARLAAELEATRARLDLPRLEALDAPGAPAPELDAATQERLRELGYAQ